MRSGLVLTVVKIVLGLGFLAYLVYVIDPTSVWEAARQAHLLPLVGAALLVPLNIAIETSIWKSVLEQMGVRYRWQFLLGSVMAGFALGSVTPARIGEFAGRAYYLSAPDRWRGAFSLALSRQPELSILGIAGCIGLFHLLIGLSILSGPFWGVLGFGIVATVFVTAISIKPPLIDPLTRRFGKYIPIFPASSLAGTLTDMKLGRTYLLSVLRYCVYTVQFVLLLRAFGIATPLLSLLAITAAIFLIRFLIPPITFMDLGIREGAAVFFFGAAGASTSAAFNASLMLFGLNIALPAVLGIWAVRKLIPTHRSVPEAT